MNVTKMERQQNQRLKYYRPVVKAGCVRVRGMLLFTIEKNTTKVHSWILLTHGHQSSAFAHSSCVILFFFIITLFPKHPAIVIRIVRGIW